MHPSSRGDFTAINSCPFRAFRKLRRKIFLALGCAFGLVPPTFADCTISLRWDNDPPFFMMQDARVVGIDADLVRAIAERLGCDLTLATFP